MSEQQSDRPVRNINRPNYWNLHHGISQDIVELHADGDLSNYDEEDIAILQELVQDEQSELQELEEQAARMQAEEENRRKKEVLEKLTAIQAARDRKALLKRVIAGKLPPSALKRSTTQPSPAPVSNPSSTAKPLLTSKPSSTTNSAVPSQEAQPTAKLSEYDDVIASILNLQQGNLGPFAEIMSQRANKNTSTNSSTNLNTEVGQRPNACKNLRFETVKGPSLKAPIVQLLDRIVASNNVASSGVKSEDNGSELKCHASLDDTKGDVWQAEGVQHIVNSSEESDGGTGFIIKKGKKKRKSGILSKPDEVDIVKPVRYPHELLDDRHVRGPDKVFSKLNFNLFCAGELETIKRPGISNAERAARLDILSTICYHSVYVSLEELKQQYHATMKRVERGVSQWNSSLASQLHQDLAFRASVSTRPSSEKSSTEKNITSDRKDGQGKRSDSQPKSSTKVHYCADFNKGTCIHDDHHDGKFNKQEVTLFHFCRRCLFSENKLKRSHPESDVNCPSRTS